MESRCSVLRSSLHSPIRVFPINNMEDLVKKNPPNWYEKTRF